MEQNHPVNTQIDSKLPENDFEDRAFGSIVGAVTADACGSYYEFKT